MLQNDLAQVGVDLSLHFMGGGRINAVKYARRLMKKKVLTIFMMRKRVKLARKYKKWPEKDWKEFYKYISHFIVHGKHYEKLQRSDSVRAEACYIIIMRS